MAEDSIMPLLIWKKNYEIAYADKAIGYVLYPESFNKWMQQKVRTAKAHEQLDKYVREGIRMKTFKNEVLKGFFWALTYPKNIKEFYYTFLLFLARLESWKRFFIDTRFKNNHYGETWSKIHTSSNKNK